MVSRVPAGSRMRFSRPACGRSQPFCRRASCAGGRSICVGAGLLILSLLLGLRTDGVNRQSKDNGNGGNNSGANGDGTADHGDGDI